MAYGGQNYGGVTYKSSPSLTVNSVSPARVTREGGDVLTLDGVFPASDTYTVTVNGVVAYSGVPGGGNVAERVDLNTLRCVMPRLAGTGTVSVLVTGSPSAQQGSVSLDVVEKAFGSSQFEMRRMFPPQAETGARRLELEPPE